VFLLDERVFMTLGILRVAAVLEREGHRVEMLDLSGVENYSEVVRDHATNSDASVFGLTATTPQLPAATTICESIRSVRPKAKIVLGGPHITLVNAARKQETKEGLAGRATRAFGKLTENFDVLVAGDGEEAIFQAIAPNSPRLVDADDPHSQLFLNNARLSALPMPARHLVDVESYHYWIEDARAISMIAQLGCPFGCGFCGGRQSPMLRRIRMRSVESIIDEIVHLNRSYGMTGFMFYDDELNVNPKMTEMMRSIAKIAKDLKVKFRLRGFIKAELFTDEQAKAMYEAGFRWILTGFESGSPRILKNINKRATLEENTRCVEIARRHNLKVKALMSIGHPGESRETVMETYHWLLQVRPDDFDATIITTYPGSPYHDNSVPHPSKEGVWVYNVYGDNLYSYEVDYTKVADYYKGDPDGGYKAYVYTDYLTADELVELREFIERDVRGILQIPYNLAASATRYEHSMGQFGARLPSRILKQSPADLHPQKPTRIPASWGPLNQIASAPVRMDPGDSQEPPAAAG
jgi:anaerobic magnesium-protoporphyrin IX monomethyl ester cyclase